MRCLGTDEVTQHIIVIYKVLIIRYLGIDEVSQCVSVINVTH